MDANKTSETRTPLTLGKARRSVKNYVLQPFLQIRFGLYAVLLSIFFSIIIAVDLYFNFKRFVEIVLELTGVQDEVRDLLIKYAEPAKIQIFVILVLYVLFTIFLSIKFTHKLIGPTVAFRRHIRMIREENWSHRTVLRDGDAFLEVANDLNSLSEALEKRAATNKNSNQDV